MKFSYKKIDETLSKQEKKDVWDVVTGLNKVDNLLQSKYYEEATLKEINGEYSYKEVREELNNKYILDNTVKQNEIEADLVAIRMAELLTQKKGFFRFNINSLKDIHGYIFQDIFSQIDEKYLGKFRDYNITKNEPILNNDTVIYSDFINLENNLKHDFETEEKFEYYGNTHKNIIKNITRFTANIWQVHPFVEGNTRTVAIFIEKYIRSKRLNIIMNIFKENARYFRNALVLANYENPKNKFLSDNSFLQIFFNKCIYDNDIDLPNILPINNHNTSTEEK